MSIVFRRHIRQFASALARIKSTQCHYRIRPLSTKILSQKDANSNWLYRTYCTPPRSDPLGSALIDLVSYEAVCSDTLEGLCEYFDDLVENTPHLKSADVNYSDGVLTVNLGSSHGTYVINRQSPNRQIWLSSPTSGPKRYDFVPTNKASTEGYWIYKHDGITLHELLQQEIRLIVRREVEFLNLPYGKRT
ncbi:Frataxin like, mitochondrial [Pseudolycoriella hygida]|uniref:ferroxidase n=1 Tax=Pseudolycoriella hygida TaxID=35572 RepID=A0A9Q0MV28_9DIPT|nr:Frataxin like, mitochondrial [Pseudolycoriella hygida]